jgi:hypothetical protein
MPTTKLRHMITETDQISAAVDKGASAWPELRGNRTQILRRLIEAGSAAIENERALLAARRLAAIKSATVLFRDVWPDNWRDEMNDQWPD